MPTGYGATAIDKKMSFRDYALMCTRALGICVTMRDEPLDVLPPEEFKEEEDFNLKHHREGLEKDRVELARLEAMTNEEKISFGQAEMEADRQSTQEYLDKTRASNDYFRTLIAKAEAWVPPTEEHEGLKKFMLEQAELNIDSVDYSERELEKALAAAPVDYHIAAIKQAMFGVGYHEKVLKEQTERGNTPDSRNEWLKDLRDSLPKE